MVVGMVAKVSFMENEQATMAVQSMEAAPVAGAENGREKTMSVLLEGMSAGDAAEAAPVGEDEAIVPEANEEASESSKDSETLDSTDSSGDSASSETAGSDDDAEAETAGEESAPDGKQARNFRGRWDHLDERERRVVELATKRGLTLGEAYRAVYGVEGIPALSGEDGESENTRASESMNQHSIKTNSSEPVRSADSAQTPKPGGVAPRRSVRPVPAGGSPVEAPITTLERRVSSVRSTGEMLELMREIGTPFEALLKR